MNPSDKIVKPFPINFSKQSNLAKSSCHYQNLTWIPRSGYFVVSNIHSRLKSSENLFLALLVATGLENRYILELVNRDRLTLSLFGKKEIEII